MNKIGSVLPHHTPSSLKISSVLLYTRPVITLLLKTIIIGILLAQTLHFSQVYAQDPILDNSKLSYTIDSFSDAIINNNLQLKINKINPEQVYQSYVHQKNARYPQSLNFNFTYSPLLKETTVVGNFTSTWQANFISGTTLALGIAGRLTEVPATANPPAPASDLWIVGLPQITLRQNFLRNSFVYNQNRKALRSTLYNAYASEENFKHFITTTLFNALMIYHQYLANQELIALLTKDRKDVAAILRFNKRKSRLSDLRRSDLLSSEILNIEAEDALANAQSSNEQLKNTLIFFLGKDPDKNYDLVLTGSIPLTAPTFDKTAIIDAAITHRSDYKALLTQLSRAKNDLSVNKLEKLPDLNLQLTTTLVGTGDSIADGVNNIDFASSNNYAVDIGLNFSFRTDPKWYRSITANSEREITKTELQLQQLKENIKTEIENILIAIDQNYKAFTKNKRILTFAQERYTLIRKDYRTGIIDFTTNINARRELINAQAKYLNSKLQYEISLLEFQYLTGEFHTTYNTTRLSNSNLNQEKVKKKIK
ncbi:hypothetical protein COTS27_00689 [Spirochaetota bacterium]|nr:hypothetical protein COTS27_00689 [Spirochaetota bacterium]